MILHENICLIVLKYTAAIALETQKLWFKTKMIHLICNNWAYRVELPWTV